MTAHGRTGSRQAQPVPLPGADARRRPARTAIDLLPADAGGPDRGGLGRETRWSARASTGRTWRRPRSPRCGARLARHRFGSRSTSGFRWPPGSGAAAPTRRPCCGWRRGRSGSRGGGRGDRRRRPVAARPAVRAGRRGGRTGGAAARAGRVRGRPDPVRDGARGAAEVYAEADRLGSGRPAAELDELGEAAARGPRWRGLAARVPRSCS